jgi:hypothetical protein
MGLGWFTLSRPRSSLGLEVKKGGGRRKKGERRGGKGKERRSSWF